jgi:hypothetical protein
LDSRNTQRTSATIIVKAAPRVGQTHGELVCCAGIDAAGSWVRLYPVVFRTLEDAQKFSRWDIIEYEWKLLGKSFAFIRPRNPKFIIERKSTEQFYREKEQFIQWHKHETEGLFGFMNKDIVPYEPAPYLFKYSYEIADGKREGTCQDWEVEATFLKWRRTYGEHRALQFMREKFGTEYPDKGFVLAMGTHRAYGNWLINGIVRLDRGAENRIQGSLF